MRPIAKYRAIGFTLAALIFVLDQALKAFISGPLNLREVRVIELIPFFDLRWTENPGVSLGMFAATSPEMRWGLVAVTSLIAVVVAVWMTREKLLADILGLAMILGGALGNIVDRYQLGYVIDYADFHIGDFRPFFIFNLADAAITIGVVIILVRAFFFSEDTGDADDSEPASNDTTATAPPRAEN